MFNWNDFINDFPYTNFSDINVSWFLNKFKQIFDEWQGLYTSLQNWKTATDTYNEQWRQQQEQAFQNWENNFQSAIDEWKTQTERDIGTWEDNTLANLETWKNTFITEYNALKAQVEQIAIDAESAKNAAQASAVSAQNSADSASATALSLQASLTQINNNTNDISELKTQLNDVIQEYWNLLYSGIWNDYSAIHSFVGDTIEVAAKNTATYRMSRCDIDVSNIDNVTISWASKSSESGTATGASIRYGFTTSPESDSQTWKGYISTNPYTIDTSNEDWLRIGLYVDQNVSVAQGIKATFVKIQVEEGTEATEFTKNGYSAVDFAARKNITSLNGFAAQYTPTLENLENDYIPMLQDFENNGVFSSANNIVRTVAHRGDGIIAPQCTAPSYIVARKEGFAIAENDVYMSKDGYLVMWHDSNLNRLGNLVDINGYLIYTDGTDFYYVNESVVYTWNGTDYIASSVPLSSLTRCAGADFSVTTINFNDLRRIDFGVYKNAKYAGTQILTFKEWVMLCKQLGMEIYIDKKVAYTDAQLTETAKTVRECGMGKYASWLSLNVRQINLVKAIVPDARFGTLQHPNAEAIETYSAINVGRGFFFNGDAKNGLTREAVQLGLNAGFEVETYYVDFGSATEETVLNKIREAVSYGCTGITTDHYKVNDAYKYLIDMY